MHWLIFSCYLKNRLDQTVLLSIPKISLKSYTVKPVLSGNSKRRQKIGFQYRLSLNAGQKYCRMLQDSILQYFRPTVIYHLSLRPLFLSIFEWPF